MATGRIVLSDPSGRLTDSFLPERLSPQQLVDLIKQHAPAGGSLSVQDDPSDPDYVLLSGTSVTEDLSDPDFLLVG